MLYFFQIQYSNISTIFKTMKYCRKIHSVCSWVDTNELVLNRIKCKYMVVSRLKSRAVPSQSMLLYGQPMEQVANYKYLGVVLTEDLSILTRLHVRPGGWLGCYTDDFTDGLHQEPYLDCISV